MCWFLSVIFVFFLIVVFVYLYRGNGGNVELMSIIIFFIILLFL